MRLLEIICGALVIANWVIFGVQAVKNPQQVDEALEHVHTDRPISILWVDTAGNLGFLPEDVIFIPHHSRNPVSIPRRCYASASANSAKGADTLCLPNADLWTLLGDHQ